MDEIWSFICNHWITLLIVLIELATTVILIFKKAVKIDDVKSKIFENACLAVSLVELHSKAKNMTSQEKLSEAVTYIKASLHLPDSMNDFICSVVEKLLSTPTKIK